MGWNKPCFLGLEISVWKLVNKIGLTIQNGYLRKCTHLKSISEIIKKEVINTELRIIMGQIFKKGQVWDCYKFARNMKGKHNPNMIMKREDWEIF